MPATQTSNTKTAAAIATATKPTIRELRLAHLKAKHLVPSTSPNAFNCNSPRHLKLNH
jgi:hypothetical protein